MEAGLPAMALAYRETWRETPQKRTESRGLSPTEELMEKTEMAGGHMPTRWESKEPLHGSHGWLEHLMWKRCHQYSISRDSEMIITTAKRDP
jgi:hypothetical protein